MFIFLDFYIFSTEGEQRYTIMGLGNSTVYGLMVR